jgi:hypothetical protein
MRDLHRTPTHHSGGIVSKQYPKVNLLTVNYELDNSSDSVQVNRYHSSSVSLAKRMRDFHPRFSSPEESHARQP